MADTNSKITMKVSSSEEQKDQFQFITTINTVERDNQSRRKVRSHARRVQNHKNAHSLTFVGSHSGRCQVPSSSKFKLNSWTRKAPKGKVSVAAADDTSNKKTPTPQPEGIDDRSAEILQELPLIDTLPVVLSPAMKDLLRYCTSLCAYCHIQDSPLGRFSPAFHRRIV